MSANRLPLAGVLGWPIAHSRSPRLHRHWLSRYGIEGDYITLGVEPRDFEAAFRALPLLARGAAMRFLLTRLYDWLNTPPGAMVTPKNPLEYLAKLRFHERVQSAGEYGLDVD